MKSLICLYKESSLEEKLLWLYAAVMPFIDVFYFKFHGKKIVCADIVFIALFVVCVTKYIKGKLVINKSPLYLSLFLMPILFLVSFINSVNIFDSFVEFAGLIYLIILFVLVSTIVSTSKKLRSVLCVYIFSSVLISLLGLFALFAALTSGNMETNLFLGYGTMEAMAHHFPRLSLTFESPNMSLTYLHVALVMGMIFFLTQNKGKAKFFIFLAIIIMFAAAFFTGSRRFAGFLLSIFIILSWFGRGRIATMCKYISFSGFIVVFIAAFITTIWVVFPIKITGSDAPKTLNVQIQSAYSIHCLLPAVAVNMFKKHPFIGVGFGTFNRNFKDNVDWEHLEASYGFEAYPDYPELVEKRTLNFDPHSVIFGVLAETGMFGFLGLVYFFLQYMFLLIRRFKHAVCNSFERVMYGCFLAGFIGFMLNAITLDILSMRHFWFMLAVGAVGIYPGKKLQKDNIV